MLSDTHGEKIEWNAVRVITASGNDRFAFDLTSKDEFSSAAVNYFQKYTPLTQFQFSVYYYYHCFFFFFQNASPGQQTG